MPVKLGALGQDDAVGGKAALPSLPQQVRVGLGPVCHEPQHALGVARSVRLAAAAAAAAALCAPPAALVRRPGLGVSPLAGADGSGPHLQQAL